MTIRPPDPAEVRRRQLCVGRCGHPKTSHAWPLVEDGHCLLPGCECIGWDPMTSEEWAAVMAVERGAVYCQRCGERWPCAGWIRGGGDAWEHGMLGHAR